MILTHHAVYCSSLDHVFKLYKRCICLVSDSETVLSLLVIHINIKCFQPSKVIQIRFRKCSAHEEVFAVHPCAHCLPIFPHGISDVRSHCPITRLIGSLGNCASRSRNWVSLKDSLSDQTIYLPVPSYWRTISTLQNFLHFWLLFLLLNYL